MGFEDNQALVLERAYGASCNVRGGLVNLSTVTRSAVCFVSSHVAIIHDIESREQLMLQGHCNPICGLATNPGRTLVVSADVGPDSMIIVWDALTGEPLHTIPSPTPYGFRAIAMSQDGSMLAAITAPPAQQVHVWELGPARSGGILASHISGGVVRPEDPHRMIAFSPNPGLELVTQGRKSIAFWAPHHAAFDRLVMYEPTLNPVDFKQSVGEFTMSAFLPGTSQACTGTVDGDVVVWSMKEGAQDASDRIATKVVRAHSAPITYLTVAGQYLVTGGGEGFVRLFDSKLRIIAWFEDIGHGSITSVAFADGARTRSPSPAAASAADDLPGPAVAVPDFAVTTSRHMVVEVPSASFSAPQQCRPIISGVSGQIACIAAHPDAPILAVGTRGGRVELWDTEKHVRLAQAALPHNAPPSVMRYSRVGGLLAVGTAAGHVVLYDGRSARESAVVRNTRAPILHLDVGRSSDRVIAGDAQGCLLLYAQQPMRGVLQWELLGKFRGHGAGLAGVAFLDDRQGYETLVSMGRDGAVCEFDLGACSHSEGMVLNDARTFPPSRFPGRPGCLAVVPPSVRLCEQQCRGAAVLCADETLKLRLLDLDHAKTTVTVLGPTFGGAVRMLQPFVAHGTGVPCVAYATEDKVCGIVVGPVDGCPDKTLGVIAHPGPISGIAVSHDGARVFTSSGEDPIVNVWRVGAAATEEMSRLGGEVADWVAAVEGGMDGAMMQEIQDTFYYCQVLAQKEPSLTHVPGRIPAQLVPDFLKSLGVFASDREMKQIMLEHKELINALIPEDKAKRKELIHALSFLDVLRMFVNHRPVGDILQKEVEEAFKALQRWVTTPTSDNEGDLQPSASRLPGNRSELSQGTSTAQPDRMHDVNDLPEDMIAAGALYNTRIIEAIEKYGETMEREEQSQVAGSLFGAGILAQVIPEVCEPHQFMEDVLGFVRD